MAMNAVTDTAAPIVPRVSWWYMQTCPWAHASPSLTNSRREFAESCRAPQQFRNSSTISESRRLPDAGRGPSPRNPLPHRSADYPRRIGHSPSPVRHGRSPVRGSPRRRGSSVHKHAPFPPRPRCAYPEGRQVNPESMVPSEEKMSLRPKLKLLPRTKPLPVTEPAVVDYKQVPQQQINTSYSEAGDQSPVNGRQLKPGLGSSEVIPGKPGLIGSELANQAAERPKLNSKPRSQPLDQPGLNTESKRSADYPRRIDRCPNPVRRGGSPVRGSPRRRGSSVHKHAPFPPRPRCAYPEGRQVNPESMVPSEEKMSERPKLKLLPRTKPLPVIEPAVVDYKQVPQQQINTSYSEAGGQSPVNGRQLKPGLGSSEVIPGKPGLIGSEVANQAAERPKLNLKPRSQPLDQPGLNTESKRGSPRRRGSSVHKHAPFPPRPRCAYPEGRQVNPESMVPSEEKMSERPKLKLLPRTKPLPVIEPAVVDYKQVPQQQINTSYSEAGGRSPVNVRQLKPGLGSSEVIPGKPGLIGSEVANQAAERPKLNLKSRSQPLDQPGLNTESKRNENTSHGCPRSSSPTDLPKYTTKGRGFTPTFSDAQQYHRSPDGKSVWTGRKYYRFIPKSLLPARNPPPPRGAPPPVSPPLEASFPYDENHEPKEYDRKTNFDRPLNMLPHRSWEVIRSKNLSRANIRALTDPMDSFTYLLSNPRYYIASYNLVLGKSEERSKLNGEDYLKEELRDEFVSHGIDPRNTPESSMFEVCNFSSLSLHQIQSLLPDLKKILPEVVSKRRYKGMSIQDSWLEFLAKLWFDHGRFTGLTEFEYFSLIIDFFTHHKLDDLLEWLRSKALGRDTSTREVNLPEFPKSVVMKEKLLFELLEERFGLKAENFYPFIQVSSDRFGPLNKGFDVLAHLKFRINSEGGLYGCLSSMGKKVHPDKEIVV